MTGLPDPLLIQARRARESLAEFARLVDPEFETPEHVRKMVDGLEALERGDTRRLIVTVPPRHGKSTLASVAFPSWAYGRDPSREIAVVSYSDELAAGFSRRSRNAFEAHGPEVFGLNLAADSKSISEWSATGRKGRVYATGVGGVLTGRGAHFAVLDDISKDASSDLERQKQVEWYTSVLRTRLSLKPKGGIVVCATRWNQGDLIGWLLDQEKAGGEKWDVIELPMVGETPEGDPKILWPERFTWEEALALRRAVGERVWNSLYQCRPTDPEGGIIKRAWLRSYVTRPTCINLTAVVDASFKNAKSSDPCCIQVWGSYGQNFYLLDQDMRRRNFTETLAAVKAMKTKWPQVRRILVETKANGEAVIDSLRKTVPGIVPVTPQGGKDARLSAVSHLFEAGNIHFPDQMNAPWVAETIEQLLAFPNGRHDDAVDCIGYALAELSKRRGGYWDGLPDGPVSSHGRGDGGSRPSHDDDYSPFSRRI